MIENQSSKPIDCFSFDLSAERYRWQMSLEMADQLLNDWTSQQDHQANDSLSTPGSSGTLEDNDE